MEVRERTGWRAGGEDRRESGPGGCSWGKLLRGAAAPAGERASRAANARVEGGGAKGAVRD